MKGITYNRIVLYAILTELTLVVIQFAYLKIYSANYPGTELTFSEQYMKTRGFYVFQILGFFCYALIIFLLSGKLENRKLSKTLVFVITGGVIELSFYLLMQAPYEGAYLYSILDKFVGAASGLILYYYAGKQAKKPSTY